MFTLRSSQQSSISAPRLLILLSSVLLVAATVTGEEENSHQPPPINEIIQNVQEQNAGLKRAVVQIHPGQGAPDGGGRMVWKRGSFVHSQNYRINTRGRLHLYETVSDQEQNAYQFNTILPGGNSFTFALRRPYGKIPDPAYGISDYFLLSFSASRDVDVKYPGYLMSINLFPQRLQLYKNRYRTSYETIEGTRYIVLQRERVMLHEFYFREKLYLNPETWRFEEVRLKDRRRRYILTATSFQKIKEVSLPAGVEARSPGFENPFSFQLQYRVKWKKVNDRDVRKPDWIQDPGLPEVSDVNTRAIHRKLRRNQVDATLYSSLMQAAIRYRFMLNASHFHPEPFKKSVEMASKNHPTSRLLKAFRDGIYSRTRITDEDKTFITAFPSISKNVQHPYMNYAAAYRAFRQRDLKTFRTYLDPIASQFPYPRVRKRLQFLNALRQATSDVEFRALLTNYLTGDQIKHRIGLVTALIRHIHQKNTTSRMRIVKETAKREDAVLLYYTLAEYFSARKNFQRANRYYKLLLDDSYFQPRIHSYISRAGFQAMPLIDRMEENITLVWLLLRRALQYMQDGSTERSLTIVERILDHLKNEEIRVLGSLPSGDEKDYLSDLSVLLRLMIRRDQGSTARKLLVSFMQTYPSASWSQPRLVESLDTIAGEGTTARYSIAKHYFVLGHDRIAKDLLPPDRLRTILFKRMDKQKITSRDRLVLARLISHRHLKKPELLQRAMSVLQKRLKDESRDESTPYLYAALADGYYQHQQYSKAAGTYHHLLSYVRDRKPPESFPSLFRSVSLDRVSSAYTGTPKFDPVSDPVIVKLAQSLVKGGTNRKKSVKLLKHHARLYGNGTSPALAFLVAGFREPSLRLLIHRFRKPGQKEFKKKLLQTLATMLKSDNRYAEAALLYSLAIREKKMETDEIRATYQSLQKKIDRSKLIEELAARDYDNPSPGTKQRVQNVLQKIKKAKNQKQRMKHVVHLMNMSENVIPVLLNVRKKESSIQPYVQKVLETLRMRQMQKNLLSPHLLPARSKSR